MDAQMTVPEDSPPSAKRAATAATPDPKSASDRQIALVRRACAIIDERAGERVTLNELGEQLGVQAVFLKIPVLAIL